MITILFIVSRSTHLKKVFKSIEALERPTDTELLIVIDGHDHKLQQTVDNQLDQITYKSVRIITFDSDGALDTIDQRRYRISALHNFAKHYISDKSDYVLSIEDDTTFPKDGLTKMLDYFNDPHCGFVEGVELGRHNTPYVGAWSVDDYQNPTKITSLMPGDNQPFEKILPFTGSKIAAGGLYFCLIRAQLYKQHHYEPYDKEGTNGLSCDVNLGLAISNKGYDCFIDWSIICKHHTDDGYISLENTEPTKIQFTKSDNKWTVAKIN